MEMNLFLREIKESDLKLILTNRNHPEIRKFMFNSDEFSWESHKAWFEKLITDSSRKSFVFEVNGTPQGVVNFVNLKSSKRAEWGFYAFPDSPPGTGTQMGICALDKYFLDLGGNRLNAE